MLETGERRRDSPCLCPSVAVADLGQHKCLDGISGPSKHRKVVPSVDAHWAGAVAAADAHRAGVRAVADDAHAVVITTPPPGVDPCEPRGPLGSEMTEVDDHRCIDLREESVQCHDCA